MLRTLVRFDIVAYHENMKESTKDNVELLEHNLFTTLNTVRERCEENEEEWIIQYEGYTDCTPKNRVLPTRTEWTFVSSESTYDSIVKYFNECEEYNINTFFIDKYT